MNLPRRWRSHRPIAAAVAAVCAAGLLMASPPGLASAAGPDELPSALVTLGDSFMSGEGGRWQGNSDNYDDSRDGTDRAYNDKGVIKYDPRIVYGASYGNGCNRSDSAEGRSSGVLSAQLNLACSGATTANIINTPFKGEPPQSDQLLAVLKTYRVQLVAVSIGGNDLGFGDIIAACVKAYQFNRDPCNPAQQAAVEQRLGPAMAGVAAAIAKIKATVGDGARIILQSAPSPVPRAKEIRYAQDDPDNHRMYVGGCPFWNVDADWARNTLVSEISTALSKVAAAQKVDFLDLHDAFQGREVCAKDSSLVTSAAPPSPVTSEWARFLVSGLTQGQLQESFHPSYFGQLALGRCLALMAARPSIHQAGCLNTPNAGPDEMYLDLV